MEDRLGIYGKTMMDRNDNLLQRLHGLSALSRLTEEDYKKAFRDSNVGLEEYIRNLKNYSNNNRCAKKAIGLNKLRIEFKNGQVEVKHSSKGEVVITEKESQTVVAYKGSLVDVEYSKYTLQVEAIDIVCPRRPTRYVIYDNIVSCIVNLLKTYRDKSYVIKPENEWFDPIIASQNIEDALYELITHLEKNNTVCTLKISKYMEKIDELYTDLFGTRL